MLSRVVVVLALFLSCAPVAWAQVGALPGSGNSVSLIFTPQYPAPNSLVHLQLQSPVLDLEGASITWFRDGKVLPTSSETASLDVVSGPLGSRSEIVAQIVTRDGTEAQTANTIIPTTVELLYEADTYVPPFYRGRALPSGGTTLQLHAIPRFERPDGTLIPTKNIQFTWRRGSDVLKTQSGLGKNTARIPLAPFTNDASISLETSTADGAFSNRTELRIPIVDPLVRLYEHHPLFGILYHEALQTQSTIEDTELTLHASPFYAPTQDDRDPNLAYLWSVDDVRVASSTSENEITVRPRSGAADIALEITHASNIFFNTTGLWHITLRTGIETSNTNPFSTSQ